MPILISVFFCVLLWLFFCGLAYCFNQSPIALATAGVMVLSGNDAYSATSPVFAGVNRWLIPGRCTTSTGR